MAMNVNSGPYLFVLQVRTGNMRNTENVRYCEILYVFPPFLNHISIQSNYRALSEITIW